MLVVLFFDLLTQLHITFHFIYICIRYRRNQPLRIYMLRIVEYFFSGAFLDQTAVVHDADVLAHMTYNSEVVGDEQHGQIHVLLDFLHEIEAGRNRERIIRWGPRTLDLDILFYDNLTCNSRTLTIPHVDMHNRLFVLQPLVEIAPWWVHPWKGKSVSELYKELKG